MGLAGAGSAPGARGFPPPVGSADFLQHVCRPLPWDLALRDVPDTVGGGAGAHEPGRRPRARLRVLRLPTAPRSVVLARCPDRGEPDAPTVCVHHSRRASAARLPVDLSRGFQAPPVVVGPGDCPGSAAARRREGRPAVLPEPAAGSSQRVLDRGQPHGATESPVRGSGAEREVRLGRRVAGRGGVGQVDARCAVARGGPVAAVHGSRGPPAGRVPRCLLGDARSGAVARLAWGVGGGPVPRGTAGGAPHPARPALRAADLAGKAGCGAREIVGGRRQRDASRGPPACLRGPVPTAAPSRGRLLSEPDRLLPRFEDRERAVLVLVGTPAAVGAFGASGRPQGVRDAGGIRGGAGFRDGQRPDRAFRSPRGPCSAPRKPVP